ncbi:MAG: nuclear transport factor 2 family protein [Bacteroidetes bacterium]|nr:nuclear transport factor 2 family protein [Bacteroidota bacterium]
MKSTLLFVFILISAFSFGQTKPEQEILRLSKQIFDYEVTNKFDSLEKIFDENFVAVGSSGEAQNKQKYLKGLRDGDFIHHSIEVEQDTAIVVNNTATVFGKGKFTVTSTGNKVTLNLSYIEVFTRSKSTGEWKIMAMHASILGH